MSALCACTSFVAAAILASWTTWFAPSDARYSHHQSGSAHQRRWRAPKQVATCVNKAFRLLLRLLCVHADETPAIRTRDKERSSS
jgi:hypothetical protein